MFARLARIHRLAPAAIVTAMAALALAVSGGIASAAPVAPAAPAAPATTSRPTLHTLHLINGWQPATATFQTSGPAYAIQNGIVYLNGSVTQASGNKPVFAVLPKAARPARELWLTVYTADGTTGTLLIKPNGVMASDSAGPGTEAAKLTSITGVSFPARPTTLTKLTLRNGWKSDQATFLSGDPSYTVRNGIVYLAGSLTQPKAGNKEFAVLPKSARPAHKILIDVYTDGGTPGRLSISPNGTMLAFDGLATIFTSLASISFPAASVSGHLLTLVNSWESAQAVKGTGDPAYTVRGGVVYLSGSLQNQVVATPEFAVLPAAARPAHWEYFIVQCRDGIGFISISPAGQMEAFSQITNDAQIFTSLAAISYLAKS